MTETMNFGPEWMKNSPGANQMGASTQKTPTTPTTPNSVGFRKFALAEFRYGKEDMLTLYAPDNLKLSNDVVRSVSLITSEVVMPMAFLPFTEEEQLLFAGCVNSSNSLRLAGRGGGPPARGGRGGRGRGRGRGTNDGGYYHRSYSYEEHPGGGNGDHFNWQSDGNRGGYEYGRGRGGGGSGGNRSGWSNNSWRGNINSSEESERWSSGTSNRWPPPNSGNQHPGRSDSGWRSRDESKKDSLLPEWAQQDGTHNTENKSTQKENSSEMKEKPPDETVVVKDEVTDKHPVTRTEVKLEERHPVSTTVPKDANTAPPVVNSNVGAQEAPINKAEDIESARTFTEKRVTPLEPVVNSMKHSAPKRVAESNSRTKRSLSEEPISPDGFTHFEKAAEDLLLTEEEETPSSSPTVFSSSNPPGHTISTAYPSTASSALTFTNNHINSSHPLTNAIPSVASTILQHNASKPVSLPTPDRGVIALEELFTWYYQDPDGMVQGPFTSGEMKEWFDAGYFTMDLMVRRACDNHMLPLGQVIQMWKRIPFVTEGKQPPPVNITEPFWQTLIQRQPMLFQQRQHPQPQHLSLQTTTQHSSTANDLTATAESIWGRSPIQEKAPTSSQWPNIETVWEQSNSNSQEELIRLKQQQEEQSRRMEKKKERERQKKAEEEHRKKEEAQRRMEEELRIRQQQELEAKVLREVQEKKEREQLRLIEEERRRKEEQEAELERERLRQRQERLAAAAATEQRRIEETKRLQQREEEERRLKEQQQASLEAQHRKNQQQLQLQQHQLQQQQQPAWSMVGPYSNPSQVTGGASLLQIQQQEEARVKKQQLLREQQLRAQQMAAAAAQMQAASGGWTGVGQGVATSPTTGKSFLEIQLEQQKTVESNPPPVQRQVSAPGFGSVWSNPGTSSTSSHPPPARHNSSSGTTTGWQIQPGTPQRLPKMNEMDDDFWDLCMKDIPAAHRPSALPQSQTRTSVSKAKKMEKHEERIRNIFSTPLAIASDALVEWCEQQFTTIQTELDAATFVNFLLQFESPYEVHDYIKLHMGDSPTTQEFTRQFLEKAKQCKQQKQPTSSAQPSSTSQVAKPKPTPQQQAFPPPSSTMVPKQPSRQDNIANKTATSVASAATAAGANGGGKKKKKGKMQKVDPASILGFSVNAAERPNAGEIQSVHDVH